MLLLCFFLETSKVDYVLFEAAGLLKDGLIREWASLSNDEVKGLRSYLLSYVINHPTLSSYIRERIVQVVAIAIKRQSVDDLGEDRRQVRNGAKAFLKSWLQNYRVSHAKGQLISKGLFGFSILPKNERKISAPVGWGKN